VQQRRQEDPITRVEPHFLVVGAPEELEKGRGEHRGAGQEHALAADQVAEPSGQQQQAAERDQIGVDDPAEADRGKAQAVLDGRHRHGHDAAVENDHQHPRGDHPEGEPARPERGRSEGSGHGVSPCRMGNRRDL
jgi:hypothetical protein